MLDIFTLTAPKVLGGWFWKRQRHRATSPTGPHPACPEEHLGVEGNPISSGGETEAQRGVWTIPKPHSKLTLGLEWKGLKPEGHMDCD